MDAKAAVFSRQEEQTRGEFLPSDKGPVLPVTELHFADGSHGVLFAVSGGGSSAGPWDTGSFAELISYSLARSYPGSLVLKSSLKEQHFSRILAKTFKPTL